MELSLEHQIALLPPDQQQAVLGDVNPESLLYDWRYTARPSQILPTLPGESNLDWTVALIMAGRGFGKTLLGAQWIRELDNNWKTMHRDREHMRFALLGRTAADVRDVMLEGPSGLMRIYPPSVLSRIHWIPSRRRVELPNGSVGIVFSSEEPDQLRGPAFHVGWSDELAAYKQIRALEDELTAWQNLRIAVRLGEQPQVLATTTPKRVPLMRELLAEAGSGRTKMLLRRGKTSDNSKLSQAYMDTLFGLYAGTRLGAQELEGEMLDDVAGAMTTEAIISRNRVQHLPPNIPWIKILAIDPAVAEKPRDECGMVLIYVSKTWPILNRHAFVVEDFSDRVPPEEWGATAVRVANQHQAVVIAEVNQGAHLVTLLMKQMADQLKLPVPPVKPVWASKSKSVRAELISAAYSRDRVHHVNVLAELENQITSWVAGESGYSPDRQDALVHGIAASLFPEALTGASTGGGQIHIPSRRTAAIPTGHQVLKDRRPA